MASKLQFDRSNWYARYAYETCDVALDFDVHIVHLPTAVNSVVDIFRLIWDQLKTKQEIVFYVSSEIRAIFSCECYICSEEFLGGTVEKLIKFDFLFALKSYAKRERELQKFERSSPQTILNSSSINDFYVIILTKYPSEPYRSHFWEVF